MKKTLIASAILATLAATSAQANVTVFQDDMSKVELNGRIEATMTKQDQDSAVLNDYGHNTFFRMGVAADTKIMEGLTGLAYAELEYNVSKSDAEATDNKNVETRLAYVGVQGDFGTVTYGRQSGVDYLVTDFVDTALVVGGTSAHLSSKANNMVKYEGAFDALKVSAQIQLESNETVAAHSSIHATTGVATAVPVASHTESNMGLAVSYALDFGLDLGASYLVENKTTATTDEDTKTYVLGAQYTFDALTAAAAYSSNKVEDADATKGFDLSVAYNMDKVTLLATYNKAEKNDVDTTDHMTFGVKYDLSSNLNVRAEYLAAQMDGAEDVFGVRARYDF